MQAKEVFGPMFVAMINGEMESYNGYFDKIIKTSMGETEIGVPRDRQASFESVILPFS